MVRTVGLHLLHRGIRRFPPVTRQHETPATGLYGDYPDRTYTGEQMVACKAHQTVMISDRGFKLLFTALGKNIHDAQALLRPASYSL